MLISYSKDAKEISGGKQKLRNMKKIVQYIEQIEHLIG
jgi:hypothetical protein